MINLLVRFVFGGIAVSMFALTGDLFRPKSFAGLLGAAPSVAIATLALTVAQDGKLYAATPASPASRAWSGPRSIWRRSAGPLRSIGRTWSHLSSAHFLCGA